MSIVIVVNNSYSQVLGLSASQEKQLKEALSYTVDDSAAYFSGRFGPRKKCLLDKKGFFPTGLLQKVHAEVPEASIVDKRVVPVRFPCLPLQPGAPTPYSSQIDAACTLQERGTISMPTGTGKSLVIALLAAKRNAPTLVVVPTLEIKKQLTEAIRSFLGPSHKVDVHNIDSVPTNKQYACLIIDEAHHTASKTYHNLNKTAWKDIYYRYFLTATPFRNNSDENLLFEAIAGQVIYSLSYAKALQLEQIVPVEAYFYETPVVKNDLMTWPEVYSKLVVKNTARNELIGLLLLRLQAAGRATLCLVKEVAHGKELAKLTGLPFVNGADEDSRKLISSFNNGTITALIGTTGILGEGVDTKPAEYIIIAGLGKAKSAFMQQVGRGVRKFPGKESAKVILIKDRSHTYTLRHFNAQAKILKEEYGVKPIKLEI